MALRVLLADESSTIKKVIQLALQDYGVQVKTVNVGVDALEVARSFSPDIVFADILLQKKSGYDVCTEIKKDRALATTPVILMWSGFLELDEKQFKLSHADDQLEKPFNVETLRALIQKWVPKTKTQEMSDFLEFPQSISTLTAGAEMPPPLAQAQKAAVTTAPVIITPPPPPPPPQAATATVQPSSSTWDTDNFDDIQNFVDSAQATEAPHLAILKPEKAEPVNDVDDEPWLTKDLSKFKLNIPEDGELTLPPPAKPEPIETTQADISVVTEVAEIKPGPGKLNAEELETLLRAQSREIIESVVWKIVPELAGTIIREELGRLLREEEAR